MKTIGNSITNIFRVLHQVKDADYNNTTTQGLLHISRLEIINSYYYYLE